MLPPSIIITSNDRRGPGCQGKADPLAPSQALDTRYSSTAFLSLLQINTVWITSVLRIVSFSLSRDFILFDSVLPQGSTSCFRGRAEGSEIHPGTQTTSRQAAICRFKVQKGQGGRQCALEGGKSAIWWLYLKHRGLECIVFCSDSVPRS